MDGRSNGSFWPSYVDIMTTLFAIMLVLFAVSFSRFKIKEQELEEKNKQLKVLVDNYKSIINIYSTVSSIDETAYFGYDSQFLKHMFQVHVEFQAKQYDLNSKLQFDLTNPAKADETRKKIVDAGQLIKNKIKQLNDSIPQTQDNNIKFLVIIEGQSSRVAFNEGDWKNNYTLSYLRAKGLNDFWINHGIDLSLLPRCEILIVGSGEKGVPRYVPDESKLKAQYPNSMDFQREWTKIEERNQRFLINIVPVLGNIDDIKAKIEQISINE